MPNNDNLHSITVRLHQDTLNTIQDIVTSLNRLTPGHLATRGALPVTRSQIIRHVINTGLDVMTGAEPIELQEPPPCHDSTPAPQLKTITPATA